MKNIECIFCGKESEKAKEHIWPRWLQKHLIGDTRSRFDGIHMVFTRPDLIDRRTQSGESLVFGNVCKDCNSGWMNNLENKFRILFQKIQSDYSCINKLTKKERITISLWGVKTAMMINAGSNYRKIIPRQHYRHICQFGQVPKDVKVDICYIESDKLLQWEQANITLASHSRTGMDSYDPYHLIKNSYVISMQIEHLGIKVTYYKDCKKNGSEIEIGRDYRSIRVWPFCKNGFFSIHKSYAELQNFQIDTFLKM